MKLNYYLIQKVTNCGCLNRTQAELLDTPFPLRVGWIASLEGLEISEDLYAKVMANRGLKPKQRRKLAREQQQPALLWK